MSETSNRNSSNVPRWSFNGATGDFIILDYESETHGQKVKIVLKDGDEGFKNN